MAEGVESDGEGGAVTGDIIMIVKRSGRPCNT